MLVRTILTTAVTTAAVVGFVAPVRAHVTYRDLDAPPTIVGTNFAGTPIADPCLGSATGCQSSNAFTKYGWRRGTEPTLGDSHFLTVNAEFWRFHLDTASHVTIQFVQVEPGIDPAISLYAGLLPVNAHDDTAVDPLNNVDDTTFCAAASPADAHVLPFDYAEHDGFRDTLLYSTTGGLDVDQCSPLHPFVGQFDAFADWSMANADGEWSKITYLASVSATAFNGHAGGVHFAGTTSELAGTGEVLAIDLGPGDYFVAVGGESCSDDTLPCTLPRLYGTVTYEREPLASDAGSDSPSADALATDADQDATDNSADGTSVDSEISDGGQPESEGSTIELDEATIDAGRPDAGGVGDAKAETAPSADSAVEAARADANDAGADHSLTSMDATSDASSTPPDVSTVGSDGVTADGSRGQDAGAVDAQVAEEAGPDVPVDTGCSCSIGKRAGRLPAGSFAWVVLVAAALARVRRRRRCSL